MGTDMIGRDVQWNTHFQSISHMILSVSDISNDNWFAVNNGVFGYEWGDSPIILGNPMYYFIGHMLFWLKHREIDEKSHWSTATHLMFTVNQSVVAFFRHVTTYCDVILTASFRTFLCGSPAISRRRQADYHSLIIESDSRRFHWLTLNKNSSLSTNKDFNYLWYQSRQIKICFLEQFRT